MARSSIAVNCCWPNNSFFQLYSWFSAQCPISFTQSFALSSLLSLYSFCTAPCIGDSHESEPCNKEQCNAIPLAAQGLVGVKLDSGEVDAKHDGADMDDVDHDPSDHHGKCRPIFKTINKLTIIYGVWSCNWHIDIDFPVYDYGCQLQRWIGRFLWHCTMSAFWVRFNLYPFKFAFPIQVV